MVLIWPFVSLCSDRRMLCTRRAVSGLGPWQRVASTFVTLPHRAGPHALDMRLYRACLTWTAYVRW